VDDLHVIHANPQLVGAIWAKVVSSPWPCGRRRSLLLLPDGSILTVALSIRRLGWRATAEGADLAVGRHSDSDDAAFRAGLPLLFADFVILHRVERLLERAA